MNTTSIIVGGIVLVIVAAIAFYLVSADGLFQNTVVPTPTPIVNTTTPRTPIVTTDSLVVPTNTSAVVTGSITPNGALTSYWYEYGTTAALGSKSSTQDIGSGYMSIPSPAYIAGLTKSTTYYYRLTAENRFGTVSGIQRSFATTIDSPAPVGSAPNTKTVPATVITHSGATIAGEITPNSVATQYWFEYGSTPDLGNITSFVSAGSGILRVSVSESISGLQPLTTYYFRINAQNQFGTVNGSVLTLKTTGQPEANAPTVNTNSATLVTTSSATLRGSVTPNGESVTYWFDYSTDQNFVTSLLNATPHLAIAAGSNPVLVNTPITNLAGKTTYYVRLNVQNTTGTVRGDTETFKTK